jgi:hypothetical protein
MAENKAYLAAPLVCIIEAKKDNSDLAPVSSRRIAVISPNDCGARTLSHCPALAVRANRGKAVSTDWPLVGACSRASGSAWERAWGGSASRQN